MTQLHLQETTEAGNKPARGAVFVRGFKIAYRPIIALVILMVVAVGFKTADGHRLDAHAPAIAPNITTVQRHKREFTLKNIRSDINRTKGLALKTVRSRGGNIAIEGTAVSPDAVAEMISNLQSTGYFSNIEITESYQDDSTNKTKTFKFEVTCEVDGSQS